MRSSWYLKTRHTVSNWGLLGKFCSSKEPDSFQFVGDFISGPFILPFVVAIVARSIGKSHHFEFFAIQFWEAQVGYLTYYVFFTKAGKQRNRCYFRGIRGGGKMVGFVGNQKTKLGCFHWDLVPGSSFSPPSESFPSAFLSSFFQQLGAATGFHLTIINGPYWVIDSHWSIFISMTVFRFILPKEAEKAFYYGSVNEKALVSGEGESGFDFRALNPDMVDVPWWQAVQFFWTQADLRYNFSQRKSVRWIMKTQHLH